MTRSGLRYRGRRHRRRRPRATETASALGANAFAIGTDIVFGEGRYRPGSRDTERTLAHELTHVVQQDRFGPGDPGRRSDRGDASEREAADSADRVLAGGFARVSAAPTAAVARDEASMTCSPDDPESYMSVAPPVSSSAAPAPAASSTPAASPAPAGPAPFYPTYNEAAYGIMNSCADPAWTAQALVNAANVDLAGHGMPPVGLGTLPAGNTNLGEGNFTDWTLDVNPSQFSTETADHQARPMEERADAANTIAHEGFHEYQWYEMARLQNGLGQTTGGPANEMSPAVAAQAAANPILQSDAHTAQVQEWYESVYGAGRAGRETTLGNLGTPNQDMGAYCALPEERDAWSTGRETTEYFRQLEGVPDPARDRSICH